MLAFHIGAIAALFMFSWKALIVGVIVYWVAGSLGIGMGYHRLLTHRGYKCPKWLEYVLTVCATLTLEGGPIFWVATHRVHHQLTDKPGDPHSPRDGGFWAHMGWILTGQTFNEEIPAGLHPQSGAIVGHKTGSISSVQHDAAVVRLPDGRSYVLVLLANDFGATEEGREKVYAAARKMSRAVWEAMVAP